MIIAVFKLYWAAHLSTASRDYVILRLEPVKLVILRALNSAQYETEVRKRIQAGKPPKYGVDEPYLIGRVRLEH